MQLPTMQGDERATIEAAYRDHSDAVRNLLRRRLDNEDDVAELTQEAYLRLLRYGDRGPESLKRLLFRVATNLAASHHRSSRVRHEHGRLSVDQMELPDGGPTAEEAYECDERLRMATSALWELPRHCRRVFELSRLDGVRHREIARRYGISLRLVEKHITRARTTLREQVEEA
ncbi:RNA polymerase sigma factor [Salinisphaera sp. PC39]|uniref:RNA polymerase sigma factor n=1 Tax=Salinisphaera sp. PC39 TaxID=1304156 RepID=UPI00333EEF1E